MVLLSMILPLSFQSQEVEKAGKMKTCQENKLLADSSTKKHEKESSVPKASRLPSANSRDKAGWKPAVQTKTYYILDFKPNAAKEQRRKVTTQLNLYAPALAKRANLSLEKIRCAWFDEEDFFSFRPKILK